jgi:hypothetical protein
VTEPYVPPPEEPREITQMREDHATNVRAWVRTHVNQSGLSDLDFAYALHRLTYGQAKILARRSLEIYQENEGGTL